MDEDELPAAAVSAAAAAARALMRTEAAGEEALVETLAAAAIVTAERFCGCRWIARAEDGGGGEWARVPAPVRQGVAMLVQYLWEDRGRSEAPPAAVAALWRPFRVMRLTR